MPKTIEFCGYKGLHKCGHMNFMTKSFARGGKNFEIFTTFEDDITSFKSLKQLLSIIKTTHFNSLKPLMSIQFRAKTCV
jgi:hypothetical protein